MTFERDAFEPGLTGNQIGDDEHHHYPYARPLHVGWHRDEQATGSRMPRTTRNGKCCVTSVETAAGLPRNSRKLYASCAVRIRVSTRLRTQRTSISKSGQSHLGGHREVLTGELAQHLSISVQ